MELANTSFSLMELFRMGGLVMWILLLFSIVTIGITVERAIYFFNHNLKLDDLKKQVLHCIQSENYTEAKVFLEHHCAKRLGARPLLALVNRASVNEHKTSPERFMKYLEKTMETEAANSVASLESGLNLLSTMASISPLAGFLGTATGMIGAFRSIAAAADVNAQLVASGIYEALVTTVFGLFIALVAMSAHSVFTNIVDKFAADLESACSDIIIELSEIHEVDEEDALPVAEIGLIQRAAEFQSEPIVIAKTADHEN